VGGCIPYGGSAPESGCSILCQKCAKTHLRPSENAKYFPGVIPRAPKEGGKGREAERGRGEGEKMGRIGEGREGKGRKGKEGEAKRGGATAPQKCLSVLAPDYG
jgi:hypothetical protein